MEAITHLRGFLIAIRAIARLLEGARSLRNDTYRLAPAMVEAPRKRAIVSKLIERRAIWAPVVVDPEASDDVFLEHLHISHDREVFPVYFDRPPASENVADRLGAEILAPSQAADLGHAAFAGQWRRGLLKLAKVQGSDAETVLLDLQNALGERNAGQDLGVQIEVHLFEFVKSGKRVTHPVVLVRPHLGTCFSLSRPPVATSPQR